MEARAQLAALVGREAALVDRAARAVGHDRTPRERDQGLYEVRKSAKRARYAAESAVPVSGKPATRLAERMDAPQDDLGEHQDSVAAQSLLLEFAMAAPASGENGFTFGLLYAQERTRANDARRTYEPALRKAQPPGLGAGPNGRFGCESGGSRTEGEVGDRVASG